MEKKWQRTILLHLKEQKGGRNPLVLGFLSRILMKHGFAEMCKNTQLLCCNFGWLKRPLDYYWGNTTVFEICRIMLESCCNWTLIIPWATPIYDWTIQYFTLINTLIIDQNFIFSTGLYSFIDFPRIDVISVWQWDKEKNITLREQKKKKSRTIDLNNVT